MSTLPEQVTAALAMMDKDEFDMLIKLVEKRFNIKINISLNFDENGDLIGLSIVPNRYIVLHDFNRKKIEAIKIIRKYTGMGLREAKNLVDRIDSGLNASVSPLNTSEIDAFYAEFIREGMQAEIIGVK